MLLSLLLPMCLLLLIVLVPKIMWRHRCNFYHWAINDHHFLNFNLLPQNIVAVCEATHLFNATRLVVTLLAQVVSFRASNVLQIICLYTNMPSWQHSNPVLHVLILKTSMDEFKLSQNHGSLVFNVTNDNNVDVPKCLYHMSGCPGLVVMGGYSCS